MVFIHRAEAKRLPGITMPVNQYSNIRLQQLLLRLFIITILVAAGHLLLAQASAKPITVEAAIQAAITNNKNVTVAVMEEKIAQSNYKQTEAFYLPQVSLAYTAMVTNNPLNAFGVKLQQSKISQSDFNPALLNNPSATSDYMTRVELMQPIVNLDRTWQRKAALKQTELYGFKTQRIKEYITYQVQQAYLQLQMAYQVKAVAEDALQTVTAIHKFTADRYAQGLLQKSDLLNVEVQIKATETSIAEARSNIATASDYLSLLMNVASGTVYAADPLKAVANTEITDSVNSTRADFKAMQTAVQSYDLMIASSKKSYLPRLNAFANYQLNDKKVFGFGANAYLAGLQLSWDIFKGNQTKNKISTQVLERNKIAEELTKQKDESNLELQKTRRQLNDAGYKMQQQEAAVQLAEEALRILQNRYTQGLVNTTDVLTAQTQLAQQKLFYQQAVFTKNSTAAYLQFLTTK